ncbi:Receptor protein serine/threonine kinase, partial [Fasciolopsis buskii]
FFRVANPFLLFLLSILTEKIKNEYRLAIEYASQGSLRGLLDRGEWLSLEHVIRLARDIVRGLCFLHADYPTSNKPSIAHRDVKPENILIRSDGSACLSDFGQATVLDSRTSDEARTNSRTDHVTSNTTSTVSTSHGMNLEAVPKAGTLRYMAPEILDGAIQFTGCSILCTDIYSLALCLWELLTAVAVYPTPVDLGHCDSNPRVADLSNLSSGARISDAHRRVWLPYERELGRHGLDPEELRHLVSFRKHRPCPSDAWFESPASEILLGDFHFVPLCCCVLLTS